MLKHSFPAVLIVDDEADMRALLPEFLAGYCSRVASAATASQALAAVESGDFDLALCDIYMPGATGLELLQLAQCSQWDMSFILMTGRPELPDVIAAMRLQAADFLLKPFSMDTLRATVMRAWQNLQLQRSIREQKDMMNAGLDRRTRELQSALDNLQAACRITLEALVMALDAREHETHNHSLRVRSYAMHLAHAVGYPRTLLPFLEQAALLHDIGKIGIPDTILLKPGRLTPEEFTVLREHSRLGAEILARIPFLEATVPIVRHHHERYDGNGYPDGLKGDEIPLGARVFALADTLDAMTSDRCYRKALSWECAQEEVRRCAGTQFDPKIAEVFLQVHAWLWEELRSKADSHAPFTGGIQGSNRTTLLRQA